MEPQQQDPYNPNQPVSPPQYPPVQPPQPMAPPQAPPAPAPFSPMPQPAPQPMSQPAPQFSPQPQPPVSFGPPPMQPMTGGMPGLPRKSNMPLIIAIIAVAAAAIIAAGIYVYLTFFQTIALTTFSNSKYSLMVPTDYEQSADGDAETFVEKGDSSTASGVYVYYTAFPSALSSADVESAKTALKSRLVSSFTSSFGADGGVLSNPQATDVTFKGQSAEQLVSDVTKDGKKVGHMKIVAVVTSTALYMVGVFAHISDPGTANATDTIINSFTLK